MEKTIKLKMNEETKNIHISIDTKTIIVSFTDKKLYAKKLLELFENDQINDTYKLDTNIEDFEEKFDKNYFNDLIGVINEIIIGIDELKEKKLLVEE